MHIYGLTGTGQFDGELIDSTGVHFFKQLDPSHLDRWKGKAHQPFPILVSAMFFGFPLIKSLDELASLLTSPVEYS